MELFSKVKASPLLDMTPKTDMPFWKSGKLYKLEAVRYVHSLFLPWTLPCLHKEYMKKPEDYLAHLLGHGKWLSTHSLSDVCHTLSPLPLEFSSCSVAKLIHLGVIKFFIR
jgi:hypothetical protein